MNIREIMDLKWDEITATTNERESLFSDFKKNKEKIIELHYEIEIKQLEYLLLKRKQLKQLKQTTSPNLENDIERVERINEICIEDLQERLIKHGFKERLQEESLI